MKNRLIRKTSSITALLLAIGGIGTVWAAGPAGPGKPARSQPVAETGREAAKSDATAAAQALASVAANPESFIAGLVSQWKSAASQAGASDSWDAEFAAALRGTTPARLLAIQQATNYDGVRSILQGRPAVASVPGSSIQDLGDTLQDLTFTPVNPPCRIFDTRNYGGGVAPVAGQFRHYVVHGTAAQMAAQGGNGAAGCPAPKGEPVGIAANFTAVPLQTGHLRVYPFGGVLPTVSFLNFVVGQNIANAGIVSTCYLCGNDLTVYNAATTHHIGDVMGYFYPADIGLGIETRQGGYDITTAFVPWFTNAYPGTWVGSTNGSSTLTTTGGEEVLWTASAQVWTDEMFFNWVAGSFLGCFRNTGNGAITQMPLWQSETDFTFPTSGVSDQRSVQVSARQASMPAGTYEFGFCAISGNTFSGSLDTYAVGGVKINVTKIRRP